MTPCSECGAVNPDGYRYCGECGAMIEPAGCPVCGAAHAEGQRFCGQCGHALAGAVAAPGESGTAVFAQGRNASVPERKLATVLFADVVGFTSLAERTDHEVVARMVDAAFRRMADVVAEHGGTIDKYMGDSLMAVFGMPVAHDDDAERAVAAALAMRQLGGDLVFSIGVNSGEVMVTPIGSSGSATVIGDTVNVAARLEKAAGPGEVLCGALTAELVGERALFRQRKPVVLKGKSEPVGVWEAVSMRQPGSDPARDDLPLVGRDDELTYLSSMWQRVRRDRQYQLAIVCGDPGSGKSRLAAELAELAREDGRVVWTSYPAYGPMGGVRVAAELLRQLGPSGDRDVTARVRSLAGATDDSLRDIDPAGLQKEQLWGLGRLLEEKGDDGPLLIVVDDFHRSTESTLNLVGELPGRLGGVPLLLVLVGRNDPGEWLSRFPTASKVRLGSLGRSDAADLAQRLLCERPLTAETTQFLIDRSGGNPLYLRELVRMARSSGVLVEEEGCYTLGAAPVPPTLQALLAARLDALGRPAKLAFQHLAVLGHRGQEDQLVHLAGTPEPGGLGALMEMGLVRRDPDGTYHTSDPLLGEVAYETLPRTSRGDLHRRAAECAATQEDRGRHLERAAQYLEGDGTVAEEAAAVLVGLGIDFARSARYPEARRLLERAVALGSTDREALFALAEVQSVTHDADAAFATLELIADDPADPTVAVERDHAAGRIHMFDRPAEAVPVLHRVAERWSALGESGKQAWALANAGVASFNMSRMEEASADLESAVALFQGSGDRPGEVAAASFLCLVRPADPRVPGWLASALELAEQSGDRIRQMSALVPLAWLHSLRQIWGSVAETAEAERFAARLAAVAEELGSNDIAIHGQSLLAISARWSGRFDEAKERAAAISTLFERPDPREPWLGWAVEFSIAVAGGTSSAAPPFPPDDYVDPVAGIATEVIEAELTFAGRIDEALAHMDRGSREHGPIADAGAVLKALTLVLAGRPDEALTCVERAQAAAAQMGAGPTATMAAALRAEIKGDPSLLPPTPDDTMSASAGVVLRSRAVLGDASAAEELSRVARALAAPGLLIGVPADHRQDH